MPPLILPSGKLATLDGKPVEITQEQFEDCCCRPQCEYCYQYTPSAVLLTATAPIFASGAYSDFVGEFLCEPYGGPSCEYRYLVYPCSGGWATGWWVRIYSGEIQAGIQIFNEQTWWPYTPNCVHPYYPVGEWQRWFSGQPETCATFDFELPWWRGYGQSDGAGIVRVTAMP